MQRFQVIVWYLTKYCLQSNKCPRAHFIVFKVRCKPAQTFRCPCWVAKDKFDGFTSNGIDVRRDPNFWLEPTLGLVRGRQLKPFLSRRRMTVPNFVAVDQKCEYKGSQKLNPSVSALACLAKVCSGHLCILRIM